MNNTQKIQAFIFGVVLTLAFFALQTKGQVTVAPNWVGTLPATCSPTVQNRSLFYRYTTTGNGRGLYFCSAANTFEKLIFGTGTTNYIPYFSAAGKVASSPFSWDGSTYTWNNTALDSGFTMSFRPHSAAGNFTFGSASNFISLSELTSIGNFAAGVSLNLTSATIRNTASNIEFIGPEINHTATWNSGGTTFTAHKINITDTGSAAASKLLDLQVGGVSKASVDKAGALTVASCTGCGSGGITRSVVTSSGNFTAGSVANTDYAYLLAGAHTPTLPTAVGNTNAYTFKNNHSSAITFITTSSQTIDGFAGSTFIILPAEEITFRSDGANWISSAANKWRIIRKTSSTTFASNTTLANDPVLQFPVVTGGSYAYRLSVKFFGTQNGDYKFAITGCTLAASRPQTGFYSSEAAIVTNIHKEGYITSTSIAATNNLQGQIVLEGHIQCSDNGTFAFQAAQLTSDVSASSTGISSYLEFLRIL